MVPRSIHSRLIHAFRKARSELRGGHAVALSALAVMAFGLVGLRAIELPGPRPIAADNRLRIEVVHPVEPEIVPGSVMDVGELVDGFKGLPPPLPPLTDVLWAYEGSWEDEAFAPSPLPRRSAEIVRHDPPEPPPPSPARVVGRWFGFDGPRRDYAAERAARRARLEAMERRAWREGEARWRDRGHDRDDDSERRAGRWRPVGRSQEERLPDPRVTEEEDEAQAEEARVENLADHEAFTGPQ